MSTSRAEGGPSPKTVCVARSHRSQARQPRAAAASEGSERSRGRNSSAAPPPGRIMRPTRAPAVRAPARRAPRRESSPYCAALLPRQSLVSSVSTGGEPGLRTDGGVRSAGQRGIEIRAGKAPEGDITWPMNGAPLRGPPEGTLPAAGARARRRRRCVLSSSPPPLLNSGGLPPGREERGWRTPSPRASASAAGTC